MPRLFVYGTLMCPDIFEKVTGVRALAMPAEVRGFRRFAVKGEQYPALIKSQGGVVHGLVYRLPENLLGKLDAFEGVQYKRELVTARFENGQSELAHAYVFNPAFRHLLDQREWDFEKFLQSGKQPFIASYCLK